MTWVFLWVPRYSLVTSIFLYACGSWTLTAELQRRIQAMEMRCYRKKLHISYKNHATNEEIRAKIQQSIGPHDKLLTIVKWRKLQWYGHVSHSSGLAKTILQGTVKGGKRQGRQKKRWQDNIREWTGLEFAKFQKAVENREKWRKLVVKSSVVPQRTLRLRDMRWEEFKTERALVINDFFCGRSSWQLAVLVVCPTGVSELKKEGMFWVI